MNAREGAVFSLLQVTRGKMETARLYVLKIGVDLFFFLRRA